MLDHIIPPIDEKERHTTETTKSNDLDLRKHLDAVVLHWMYVIFTHDILNFILVDDDTVGLCWNRIVAMFHDNNLEDIFSTKAYCNRFKLVASQLENVDSSVSNTRLALKIICWLIDAYVGFVKYIQKHDLLPKLAIAKSCLKLDESRILQRGACEFGSSSSASLRMTHQASILRNHNHQNHANNNNSRVNYGKRNQKYLAVGPTLEAARVTL